MSIKPSPCKKDFSNQPKGPASSHRRVKPPYYLTDRAKQPKRGPKSAPLLDTDFLCLSTTGKRGVRVPSPTAGGGGPRKSHLWIFNRPGKHAEGIPNLTTHYYGSFQNGTNPLLCLSRATKYRAWGRFFHRFRFRYLPRARKRERKVRRPTSSQFVPAPTTFNAPFRKGRPSKRVVASPRLGRALFFGLLHLCHAEGVSGFPHPAHHNPAPNAPIVRKRAWIRVNRSAAAGRPAWYRNLLITEP